MRTGMLTLPRVMTAFLTEAISGAAAVPAAQLPFTSSRMAFMPAAVAGSLPGLPLAASSLTLSSASIAWMPGSSVWLSRRIGAAAGWAADSAGSASAETTAAPSKTLFTLFIACSLAGLCRYDGPMRQSCQLRLPITAAFSG